MFGLGDNREDQLGLGDEWGVRSEYLEPVFIPYFKEYNVIITSICCGCNHSLALDDEFDVFAWGDNQSGQCGVTDGEGTCTRKVDEPEQIEFDTKTEIKYIRCGDDYSGCVSVDKDVFLWGWNGQNQCCVDGGDQDEVWTPQCVNEYVLRETKKNEIKNVFLCFDTTLFLLE